MDDPEDALQTIVDDLEETLNTTLFRCLTQPGVFSNLKWAGWKGNYYTLSTIQLYSRKIILVDDHGLHLVWNPSNFQQYIKPLPSIIGEDGIDPTKLGALAQGMLYSYSRLVQSELDFRIANELKLLPPSLSAPNTGWKKWTDLTDRMWGNSSRHRKLTAANRFHHPSCVSGVGEDCSFEPCVVFKSYKQAEFEAFEQQQRTLLEQINHRYQYGHLRLDRIDWICRLNWHVKEHRFFNTHSKTDTFLFKHSHLLTVYVFYAALILTAMQVALQAFPTMYWSTETFGYFGFVVVFFTMGQLPFVIFYICGWHCYRIAFFYVKNHRDRMTTTTDRWMNRAMGNLSQGKHPKGKMNGRIEEA